MYPVQYSYSSHATGKAQPGYESLYTTEQSIIVMNGFAVDGIW